MNNDDIASELNGEVNNDDIVSKLITNNSNFIELCNLADKYKSELETYKEISLQEIQEIEKKIQELEKKIKEKNNGYIINSYI